LQTSISSFTTGRDSAGIWIQGYFDGSLPEGGKTVNVLFSGPARGPLRPGVYDGALDRSSTIDEDAQPTLMVWRSDIDRGDVVGRGRFEVLKITHDSVGRVLAFHAIFSLKVDGAPGGVEGEIQLNTDSTVESVNQAPGVYAGPYLNVLAGSEVVLPGIASDDELPMGSSLAYRWSGPGQVSFNDPTLLRPTATFAQVGTYWPMLSASDGELTGYYSLEVNVLPPGIETMIRVSSAPGEPSFEGCDFSATRFDGTFLCYALSTELRVQVSTRKGDIGIDLRGLALMPGYLAAPGKYAIGSRNDLSKLSVTIRGPKGTSDPQGTLDLRHLTMDMDGKITGLWMILEVAVPHNDDPMHNGRPLLIEVRFGMPEGSIGDQPPIVTAGMGQTVMQRQRAIVAGTTLSDGTSIPILSWSKVSGPGEVYFDDPGAKVTEVRMSEPGTYVLRLTADCGTHVEYGDVSVVKSPLETSLIVRGFPLVAGGESPFAGVYTAEEIQIDPLTVGSDNVVRFDVRQGGVYLFSAAFHPGDGSGPLKPGFYHSPILFDQGRHATMQISNIPGLLDAHNFRIREIEIDQLRNLTALHAEIVSDRPGGAYYLQAELRFNASSLSSTGPNLAPGVKVPGPHNVPFGPFQLDCHVTDDSLPELQPVQVTWEQMDGPSVASMDDPHCLQPTVDVTADGVYRFRVTASDGELSSSAESTIVVQRRRREYQGVIKSAGSTVGRFDLTRRTSETFTVRFTLVGQEVSLAGTFQDGEWQTSYYNPRGEKVVIQLKIVDAGTGIIGFVLVGNIVYELSGDQTQAAALAASMQKAVRAGTYNVLLNPASSTAPAGFGFGRITVRKSGVVRGSALLPDASSTAFASTATVGENLPFFAPIYRGKGALAGELEFNPSESDGQFSMGGSLFWMHPARPNNPPYSNLFTSRVNATGDRYTPPARGLNLLSHKPVYQDAMLKVSFGAEGQILSVPLRFNLDGSTVPLAKSPGFYLKVLPKTGMFRGTFVDPRDGYLRTFVGIIDPKFAAGGGFFITPEGAGRIQMDPVPVP
jgi:hypothetical protein